jgi:hypothetical protein
VAKVVEADDRDAGLVGDAFGRLGEGVGVDRLAVAVGEHPAVDVVEPDGDEGGVLVRAPSGEHVEGGAVEVDAAARGAVPAEAIVDGCTS